MDGGGGSGAGGAPISQQWSPMAVAAAGGGPSRLKEPLPVFRHLRPLPVLPASTRLALAAGSACPGAASLAAGGSCRLRVPWLKA